METNTTDKTRRSEYIDERKLLSTFLLDAYKSFDYALLFVSFSSIALSLSYSEKIHLEVTCLFRATLLLWAISLILQLSSRFLCTKEVYKQIELLNAAYTDKRDVLDKNIYKEWANWFNIFSLGIYLVGLYIFLFHVI